MSEVLGSFVRALDLGGKSVTATVQSVAMEDMGDDGKKPVVRFVGASKGLVLNMTNANVLIEAYGDDTDNWLGRQIELYPARTEFRGKIVDAVRVRMPAGAVAAPPAPAPVMVAQPATPAANPLDQSAPIEGPVDSIENDSMPF
jgi:hypothetical protein